MKKLISLMLSAALLAALLAGCGSGGNSETTTGGSAVKVDMTMEELLGKLVEEVPVEFMGGVMPLDLTDTSEDGLWNIQRYTGLEDASSITEAAVYEPMIGSIAFSLVAVRVADGQDTKTVAEAMQSGVDPRKWVCVEADDMMLAGYGDVVMLIMVASDSGLTAQSYVDAFAKTVGEPEFVLK